MLIIMFMYFLLHLYYFWGFRSQTRKPYNLIVGMSASNVSPNLQDFRKIKFCYSNLLFRIFESVVAIIYILKSSLDDDDDE